MKSVQISVLRIFALKWDGNKKPLSGLKAAITHGELDISHIKIGNWIRFCIVIDTRDTKTKQFQKLIFV